MKRLTVFLAVAVLAMFATLGTADAAGTWGDAQEINPYATFGGSGSSEASLVMCPEAGSCVVLGEYITGGLLQGFKIALVNGVWGPATEIPGLNALNQGNFVNFDTYGCSPQSCVAAGVYDDGPGQNGFLYETGGNPAIAIPGLATLNVGHNASIESVSCSSAGNCSIAGSYTNGSSSSVPFVADEVGGVWQNAQAIAGTSGGGQLHEVSCWADGECVGVGYTNISSVQTAFTVRRTAGVWASATQIPGVATIGPYSDATVLSCSAGPVCIALGTTNINGQKQSFSTMLSNGTWANAILVPGVAALDTSHQTKVFLLSCWGPTSCLAIGQWQSPSADGSWIAELSNGVWGTATDIPGVASLATGLNSAKALSCASDGTCALIGNYETVLPWQAYVMMRNSDGTYTDATPVPALTAMNAGGYADPRDITCIIGFCAAVGFYEPSSYSISSFFVAMTYTPSPSPTPAPSTDPIAPTFTG